MDENLFRAKLTQVADWDIPLVSSGGETKSPRDRRRGPKSYEEKEWELNEEEAIGEPIKTGPNDTVPPRILKVKHQPIPCDGCDRIVEGRVVELRLIQNPAPHWREKCNYCKKMKNPNNDLFELDGYNSGNVFRNYALKLERAK
jgi:hypothetical protein